MFSYFLIHVDLPEWFEDLTDDNVSAFKDVSTFKLLRLAELIPMKFIELSYKDSILHHFHIGFFLLLLSLIFYFFIVPRSSQIGQFGKKNHVFYLCLLVQVQAQFILSDDTKDGL